MTRRLLHSTETHSPTFSVVVQCIRQSLCSVDTMNSLRKFRIQCHYIIYWYCNVVVVFLPFSLLCIVGCLSAITSCYIYSVYRRWYWTTREHCTALHCCCIPLSMPIVSVVLSPHQQRIAQQRVCNARRSAARKETTKSKWLRWTIYH